MKSPYLGDVRRAVSGAEYVAQSGTHGCFGCTFNRQTSCNRPNEEQFGSCVYHSIIFIAHNDIAKALEVTRKLRGS